MKPFFLFLLCLLLSPPAFSQSKDIWQLKGELKFREIEGERILAHKFLEDENKLLLVGQTSIKLLDLTSAKFSDGQTIELKGIGSGGERLLSPDGSRMLVFGSYGTQGQKGKVKLPPSVWDVRTGRRLAVLDRTQKPVRSGRWSKNGKTLLTSSDDYLFYGQPGSSVEVAFWDGESFNKLSTLPSDKIGWLYLTDDGRKCFYSVGDVRNLLFVVKYIDGPEGPINVWDIAGGKIERTLSTGLGGVERRVVRAEMSPDERFLAAIVQPPNSRKTERRLLVWEIEKSRPAYEVRKKYEISSEPYIYDSSVSFSSDAQYFYLSAGKSLRIYETATGTQRFELPRSESLTYWLNGDSALLFSNDSNMNALDIATGRELYRHQLIYVTYESKNPDDDTTTTEVVDWTRIIPHPKLDMLLTYSNQYVKVYDSRTGKLLQTLVSPPIDFSSGKPKVSHQTLVAEAGWSRDGKTLYVIGEHKKSVSLWRLTADHPAAGQKSASN